MGELTGWSIRPFYTMARADTWINAVMHPCENKHACMHACTQNLISSTSSENHWAAPGTQTLNLLMPVWASLVHSANLASCILQLLCKMCKGSCELSFYCPKCPFTLSLARLSLEVSSVSCYSLLCSPGGSCRHIFFYSSLFSHSVTSELG